MKKKTIYKTNVWFSDNLMVCEMETLKKIRLKLYTSYSIIKKPRQSITRVSIGKLQNFQKQLKDKQPCM